MDAAVDSLFLRVNEKGKVVAFLSSISSFDRQQPAASPLTKMPASASTASILSFSSLVYDAHECAKNNNVEKLQWLLRRNPNVANKKDQVRVS